MRLVRSFINFLKKIFRIEPQNNLNVPPLPPSKLKYNPKTNKMIKKYRKVTNKHLLIKLTDGQREAIEKRMKVYKAISRAELALDLECTSNNKTTRTNYLMNYYEQFIYQLLNDN